MCGQASMNWRGGNATWNKPDEPSKFDKTKWVIASVQALTSLANMCAFKELDLSIFRFLTEVDFVFSSTWKWVIHL